MSSILTCAFCGHEYPKGTPPAEAQVLTDHIRFCEKHPMRALESECRRLSQENRLMRKALIGIVGADDKNSLEMMEQMIEENPEVPVEEKQNVKTAIQALLVTLPAPGIVP